MTRLLWLTTIAVLGLGMGCSGSSALIEACGKACGSAGISYVDRWSCRCNPPREAGR